MICFPFPKLYHMLPLWLFHFKLIWLRFKTGRFFGTYMFTRDQKQELRGRHSYIDERAKHVMVSMCDYLYMSKMSAFNIWAEATQHRKDVQLNWTLIKGMASLNPCIECQTGVDLSQHRLRARDAEPIIPAQPDSLGYAPMNYTPMNMPDEPTTKDPPGSGVITVDPPANETQPLLPKPVTPKKTREEEEYDIEAAHPKRGKAKANPCACVDSKQKS